MNSPDPRFMETLVKRPAPATAAPVPAHKMTPTMGYEDTQPSVLEVPEPPPPPASPAGRTAVLPRLQAQGDAHTWQRAQGARFEEKEILGKGAMGEVALALDHDIDRTVAIKRLLPTQHNGAAVARFVEEIRTVGRLEHPNIVPIHDVGVDAGGNYFFMMKHVKGETLQTVIERLNAGAPGYHQRFPFSVRVQIFSQMLQAVRYAHSLGIIHRDLKPANIMVGPFGEVMVMDWGLARRKTQDQATALLEDNLAKTGAAVDAADLAAAGETRPLLTTRHGALLGTPAYMSPEQAQGDLALAGERSDVYALCVILHEFLSLRHYLSAAKTLEDLLAGVHKTALPTLMPDHPHQNLPPIELLYLAIKGTHKDPTQRVPSVESLLAQVQDIMRGKVHVQCQVTFTKRALQEALAITDRFPKTVVVAVTVAAAALAVNSAALVWWLAQLAR